MILIGRKDLKLIFASVSCFIFGATAGTFCTMTYDKIQIQKEQNSKVTADECRTIFEDFAEEHYPRMKLDESFENWFDVISEVSEMTPDEYYEYVKESYERMMTPITEYDYIVSEEETRTTFKEETRPPVLE